MSAGATGAAHASWEQRFLEVLGNRGRRRSSGFVVAVRGTSSLAGLQSLCHTRDRDDGVACLTARYRLREPSLGSLLAAFATDVTERGGATEDRFRPPPASKIAPQLLPPVGDVRRDPESGGKDWLPLREMLSEMWPSPSGFVSLDHFLGAVHRALNEGQRVVLFAELHDHDAEWEVDGLLRHGLPERFGIVVTTARQDPDIGSLDMLPAGSSVLTTLDVPPQGPPLVQADYLDAPLTGDQLADVDALDRRWYARALARLVMLPDTGPMTIGVHARWGVGKSSFMRFVRWELLREAVADREHHLAEYRKAEVLVSAADQVLRYSEDSRRILARARRDYAAALVEHGRVLAKLERAAADSVLCVWFNAWLYEGATQTWAGLTHEITRAMEGSLPWWRRQVVRVRYAWRLHRPGLWTVAIGALVAALFAALALVLGYGRAGTALAGSLPPELDAVAKVLPAGTVVVAGLALLAWRLSHRFVPVSGRIAQYLRRPDYRAQMGYQHQLRDDIAFLKESLRRGDRAPRVVVFIDDLDRCSDERVLETLQAINLLLTETGCYVFLGIDTEMIVNALQRRYEAGGEVTGEVATHRARSYLDKILQLNVPLQEPDRRRSFAFLAGFFSPQARQEHAARVPAPPGPATADPAPRADAGELTWDLDVVSSPPERAEDVQVRQVEDTADELAAFDELREFLPDNPRELKRLVNIHRLVRLLARQVGWRPGPGDRRLMVGWLLFCRARPEVAARVVAEARASPDAGSVIYDDELHDFLPDPNTGGFAALTAGGLAPGTPLGEAWEIMALFRRHATPAGSGGT